MGITRADLQEERRGYVSRGLIERVAAVDVEIAKLESAEAVEYEVLDTSGANGSVVDINSSVNAGGALLAEPDPTRREDNEQPDLPPAEVETKVVTKATTPSHAAKIAAKVAKAAKADLS